MTFPGTYRDGRGPVPVTWAVLPSIRPGYAGRFEIRSTIRGVEVWGCDFDGLEPCDLQAAAGQFSLTTTGELDDCLLIGEVPCAVEVAGETRSASMRFELDLRPMSGLTPADPKSLRITCEMDGASNEVVDDWFEDGLLRLAAAMAPRAHLKACITCLYSDYSPGGHGLTGMRCHREAKEEYLAVRSKADYWPVPVTEDVAEFYLCPEYQQRIPGTGYRG